jgi:uncharacterized protein YyaL (SSP411 family)
VDWYPWGEEAFSRARREDKPIFLSIGYSTCHWCHVMERESFENVETARILNTNFVCIKVDREERPDVDRVYMAFVQASTGGGGWPMNVWLTPDLKPFFGGTYFPPESRFGLPAFPELLGRVADAWRTKRSALVEQGNSFVTSMQHTRTAFGETNRLTPALLSSAFDEMSAGFDATEGGFGRAPKFPQPATLKFLFQFAAREGTNSEAGRRALDMCLFTLRKMSAGGIHDQLGGGFHRYSVDRTWHVPHFEKMLYDQAQIARCYVDAYQFTRDPMFKQVARDILDYVGRDLTDPRGGFCSAEDADSPVDKHSNVRKEGAFYLWTADEIAQVLGNTNANTFGFIHGIQPHGNAPAGSDPHKEFTGKNILLAREQVTNAAERFNLPVSALEENLRSSKRALFEVRARRPRPQLDDKIIASWNGLMISAFARAAQVFDDPAYLQAANRSATFIRENLYSASDSQLLRSFRGGPGAVKGFVDDYAFLIQGLLDLYEASFEIRWLRWAIRLQETQDTLFWDARDGGYFSMGIQDTNILVRMKEDYDGAEPSPNSVSVINLLRLSQMTDNSGFREKAAKTLSCFAGQLENSPVNLPLMLAGLDWYLSKPKQIVLAGELNASETKRMLTTIHRRFLPKTVLLLAEGAEGQQFLGSRLAFIRDVKQLQGRTTAYVCENFVCQQPTDDPVRLDGLLQNNR